MNMATRGTEHEMAYSAATAFISHVPKASLPTTVVRDEGYQAKRTVSGGSMFVEHLEDPEPTQDELEAFDCLRDPFLSARRLSQDVSGFRSPPLSPRLSLSESHSSSIFPSLVRKLSQSASSKRARASDGRRSSKVDNFDRKGENDEVQIVWSPKLAKEHHSPRPPRRTRSGSATRGSGHLARPSMAANRRISFADEDSGEGDSSMDQDRSFAGSSWSRQQEAEEIEASLNAFSVKRFSLPNIQPRGTPKSGSDQLRSSTGHPGLYSPVEERRMSFEVLRASQVSSGSPRTGTQQPRSISPLARVNEPERHGDLWNRGWYQVRPSSPLASTSIHQSQPGLYNILSKSTSSGSSASTAVFQPAPSSGILPQPPSRPPNRRSLSASIVSLGKIVANLSSRSSSSHSRDGTDASSGSSPSFRVNGVYRVDPSSPNINPSRTSLAGSGSPRASSPLVTVAPILAMMVEEDMTKENLSTSVPLLSPSFVVENRPPLLRNAKSDDGQRKGPVSPLRQAVRPSGSLLSPTRALQPSAGSTGMPPNSSNSIEERGEGEDWLASLRGRPTNRRMSAADLFAPPSPLPQLASSLSSSSASGTASPLITSPATEKDGLDFSKKPVNIISGEQLVLQQSAADGASQPITFANRQRTTSYSSLLSSSRPSTPATGTGLKPFPQLPSSPSPTPGMRFLPNQPAHRHTQSSPAMTLAAELAQIASLGPAGGEASVLNANHAKFAAVLTAAAVASGASAANPKSPTVVIKDREKIRRLMSSRGIENAIEDSSDDEEEEEGSINKRPMAQRRKTSPSLPGDARLPKLSYAGSSSAGTEASLQPFELVRPGSSISSSKIRANSSSSTTTAAGIPRQPIFSQSGSTPSSQTSSAISSNHGNSRNAFDALFERKGVNQVDGLSSLWMAGGRRDNNKSEDSQLTVLSTSTTTGEEDEDVFQPRMAVW